ncbi:hypothetical protein ACFVZC_21005 [Streptomyces marokkonensis]|uniref:Uncharacterized protein n=1 Tax=Streptomyces marokkonensis TaxID=324855 RepID=A0ABW6Q9F9_9ACTN|nr:hypothetical protein [Streptomyces marokkonensis]
MRLRIRSVSDRLLEKVAPKQAASAVSCWQPNGCIRQGWCDSNKATHWIDPCNDREKWVCGC